MKRLMASATAAVLVLGVAGSAQANTGTISYPEYVAVSQGDSQDYVQTGLCDCTGHRIAIWINDNGDTMKRTSYDTASGDTALITYRQWDNGTWHANSSKAWCNPDCSWDSL